MIQGRPQRVLEVEAEGLQGQEAPPVPLVGLLEEEVASCKYTGVSSLLLSIHLHNFFGSNICGRRCIAMTVFVCCILSSCGVRQTNGWLLQLCFLEVLQTEPQFCWRGGLAVVMSHAGSFKAIVIHQDESPFSYQM